MDAALVDILATSLADPACAVSVGGFGALAEFQDDDVAVTRTNTMLTATSPRGACRIATVAEVDALAFETLAARADAWQCGLCLVGERSRFGTAGRGVLHELGPDRAAIDVSARDTVLFDLGVNLPHVEFGVRTRDPALLRILRAHLGEPVTAASHPVFEAIVAAGPVRVMQSAVARIEIYQPIDRHRTPAGPHTHLLPDLLAARRTHSANVPLPRDCVPLLTLHPENPLRHDDGGVRFEHMAWARFEDMLARWGDARYVHAKREALARAVAHSPDAPLPRATTRIGRLAQRVARRQVAHLVPLAAPA
ncbi:MAG: hypothetical protein AB7Q81_24165 [Gammaproteobacteria bacterium]